MRGDAAAVRALVQQRADVNAPEGDGMTALHWAAERGDADIAALLLKAGARAQAETRIGRYTPLHVAAKSGSAAVVRALVDAGANVNAATATGAVPLHFAAASGSSEAVATLLDRGADVNAREPQWGQTPLMFAADHGRVAAVRTLVARGADVGATARVVDISTRSVEDSASSRARNARVAEIQRQLAAKAAGTSQAAAAGGARGRARRGDLRRRLLLVRGDRVRRPAGGPVGDLGLHRRIEEEPHLRRGLRRIDGAR